MPSTGFGDRVRNIVLHGLRELDLSAIIRVEPVRGTRLVRLHVVCPDRDGLSPRDVSDLCWRILDAKLSASERLRILSIQTSLSESDEAESRMRVAWDPDSLVLRLEGNEAACDEMIVSLETLLESGEAPPLQVLQDGGHDGRTLTICFRRI